jgi:WD40 repeat protein
MEIGSPVYCVETFPNRPSHLAVGCESGAISIRDVSSSTEISRFSLNSPVISLRSVDSHTLYGATETHVFVHDIREGRPPKIIIESPSEIYDLTALSTLLAFATVSDGIILSDSRALRRSQVGVLPAVCSSLAFVGKTQIVAGYLDTELGFWDLNSLLFTPLPGPELTLVNPALVHAVAARDGFVIVARQTGVGVYREGKLLVEDLFEHEGPPQTITFANCFGGKECAVSGAADGTLMVLDLEKLAPIDCLCIDGEKVQGIASNEVFIAVADTSESGDIAIFGPDDFQGGDEPR